jgi:hypothetical protein
VTACLDGNLTPPRNAGSAVKCTAMAEFVYLSDPSRWVWDVQVKKDVHTLAYDEKMAKSRWKRWCREKKVCNVVSRARKTAK